MAKKRFEDLKSFKKQPTDQRGKDYAAFQHHEFHVTHKLGGRNLYLDKEARDQLIDGAPDKKTAITLIFPPQTFKSPASYQTVKDGSYFGSSKAPPNIKYIENAITEFTKNNEKALYRLVDDDLENRDKAWAEFSELLDKHEEKCHPKHFKNGGTSPAPR